MIDRDELIAELNDTGVLGAIRWAYLSATERVLTDYSAAAGHDATWVGVSRFTLLRDRLDRVFSCGNYSVPENIDGELSLDVLHAELSDRDIATLPDIDPTLVSRANLSGSPGWAHGGVRWLLASAPFGKLDGLSWPQKSPTKQRVAQQPSTYADQPTLFDHFTADEQAGLATAVSEPQLDLRTLVVAHSLEADHGNRELTIGQPRLNAGGGSAWYWRHDLLQLPPDDGGQLRPTKPAPTGPEDAPDAPVRLRRPAAEHHDLRKDA